MMNWLYVMILTLIISVTVRGKQAFLEIILYELNPDDGRYLMKKTGITGEFSNFGTAGAAEGDIVQMHPHSLCDDTDTGEEYDYGWVGVVKLTYHAVDPCHLVEKARRAVGKGATAVIFDISEHPDALKQLNEHSLNSLNQPIVLVKGMDANELMKIIEREQIARAVIKRGQPSSEALGGHFTDPALMMVCILVIVIVVTFTIRKVKCKNKNDQNSLREWTVRHTKLRTYTKPSVVAEYTTNFGSGKISDATTSSGILCAICLDPFQDGEDLRMLECSHEFHMTCIDAWLKQKRSCPLCNRSFSSPPSETSRLNPQMTRSVYRNLSVSNILRVGRRDVSSHRVETTFRPIGDSQSEYADLSSQDKSDSDLYTRSNESSSSDSEQDSDDDDDIVFQTTCPNCNQQRRFDTSSHGVNRTLLTRSSHRKQNSRRLACEDGLNRVYGTTGATDIPDSSLNLSDCPTQESISCKNYPERHSFNDVSILAVRGSLAATSGLSSSVSFTSKRAEYSSDSSAAGRKQQNCIQLGRTMTPRIEYSSSDGASNFMLASYTTLEDVLGTIDDDDNCTSSS